MASALLWVSAVGLADDIPPQQPPPGWHSSIITADGSIRDDELVEYIAEMLPRDFKGDPYVNDIKVFVQSSFGGGILDDFGRVFTPMGVPWVGGSASAWDEPSYGPPDNIASADDLGSYWTNGLSDAVLFGDAADKVSDSIATANGLDPCAPGGKISEKYGVEENPQLAGEAGGIDTAWDAASHHEVIVFSGTDNAYRHGENVEKMASAFDSLLSGSAGNVQTSLGGTTADLKRMIVDAAWNLDEPGTELVLYVDGAGDIEYDFLEGLGLLPGYPLPVDPLAGLRLTVDVPQGFIDGLTGMAKQANDTPQPAIKALLIPEGSVPDPEKFEHDLAQLNGMDTMINGLLLKGEWKTKGGGGRPGDQRSWGRRADHLGPWHQHA